MKVIIDRFEEKFVVVELENRNIINMPKELVPKGAKEGDVLEIRINREETQKRKQKIQRLWENLSN
ncbi:DUF3006 domain-containing protein [Garciella nitratireducens]|uniref:DUF3006 domain-containing protein n=1 Tax=Garciella nitratireducens DSM 15102 TaxID=1121911 RepID=A0A1T4KYC8_9FIRM|nr:DUF3006 domain-containing protein [Garciella nitratireducens]RBP38951.1 DUF3006 family protein [Garciella nitratireducens]SJZ47373.1 Protein of unknown function [Garciella nitratireducens DSM 15102]